MARQYFCIGIGISADIVLIGDSDGENIAVHAFQHAQLVRHSVALPDDMQTHALSFELFQFVPYASYLRFQKPDPPPWKLKKRTFFYG